MGYAVVDGCPAPHKLAPVLNEILSETGCSYASIYRGTDARALLEKLGKHDQAWLFEHLPPGQANPPGRSTHELRSDGVPYPGPIGRKLKWWQCGIDVDDAHVTAFIAAAAKRGWLAFRPYSSAVEFHHVNFERAPRHLRKLIAKWTTLRCGKHGWLVRRLTKQLAELGYLHAAHNGFGKGVEEAVKRFQHDEHLAADGIAGPHTKLALRAAIKRKHVGGHS